MSLLVNETFRVRAGLDRVWAFLKSPAEVAACLPGAEVTAAIDELNYEGKVKVKVGPVTTSYAGRATLKTVDESGKRVEIVGDGKESGGAGSAKLRLWASAAAVDAETTEVTVEATIDIAGRIMQYGRGLLDAVSRQLFQEFVVATTARLEGPAARLGDAPQPEFGTAEWLAMVNTRTAESPAEQIGALALLWRGFWRWLLGVLGRQAQ